MRIPSDAARQSDHRRESVADPATRSFLSCHPSWKGNVLSAAACRMYRGRARPSCHGGGCGWAGGQKSSYNARHAGVAQLVERRLPKPEVASSRLVARSTFHHRRHHRVGGHGVQAHGRPPKAHSRRHPGRFPAAAARAFQRQAPSHLPLFFGNARMKRGITCRRRRVRAVPVAGLDPATPAGSVSLRQPVRHPNHLQSPGRTMKACPAHVLPENERSRRCPHTTGLRRDPVPSRFLVRLQSVTPGGVIFHQLEPHCVEHGKGGCQGQAQDPGEIPHGRCPYR